MTGSFLAIGMAASPLTGEVVSYLNEAFQRLECGMKRNNEENYWLPSLRRGKYPPPTAYQPPLNIGCAMRK